MLELKEITKEYSLGGEITKALNGVSFFVTEGEFISIIGKSGSGKSTLMNILGGLDQQTSGSFFLKGKAFIEMNENDKASYRNKELGFIFQKFNLLKNLKAIDNIALPLIYQGFSKKRSTEKAKDMLQQIGLMDKGNHTPDQLSGGQQQRIAIARAIVTDPSVILADEPTGNLDSESTKEIMDILIELNRNGKTLIIITHDNSVAAMANRTITINNGKIISDKKNN